MSPPILSILFFARRKDPVRGIGTGKTARAGTSAKGPSVSFMGEAGRFFREVNIHRLRRCMFTVPAFTKSSNFSQLFLAIGPKERYNNMGCYINLKSHRKGVDRDAELCDAQASKQAVLLHLIFFSLISSRRTEGAFLPCRMTAFNVFAE